LLNAPPWIDVIPLQCHHPLQPRHTRAFGRSVISSRRPCNALPSVASLAHTTTALPARRHPHDAASFLQHYTPSLAALSRHAALTELNTRSRRASSRYTRASPATRVHGQQQPHAMAPTPPPSTRRPPMIILEHFELVYGWFMGALVSVLWFSRLWFRGAWSCVPCALSCTFAVHL